MPSFLVASPGLQCKGPMAERKHVLPRYPVTYNFLYVFIAIFFYILVINIKNEVTEVAATASL